MPAQLLQSSVAAGEIDPRLYYRVDLAKQHIAAKTMCNWYVQAQGNASNRPGTGWIGPTLDSTKLGRLIPFKYSTLQTYALEFGDFKMRVIMNGGYVLEAAKTITAATQANPCQLSITAHGYSTGDRIYVAGVVGMTQLNGRYFTVTNTGANTITIGVDSTGYTAFSSGASAAARVYTKTTPYAYGDLGLLGYEQSADTMTFTHKSYATYKMTRSSHTNWTFTPITFAPTQQPPVVTSGTGYVVTAINDTSGEESLQSVETATLSWTALLGCSTYSIYKKINGVFGFIGTAQSSGVPGATVTFTDPGTTIPDTSVTPPQQRNPFGAGTITAVAVTSPGTGYSASVTVVAVDTTGSGATFTVTRSGTTIGSVAVVTPGLNYSQNTTLLIKDGTGAGAAITLNFADDGSGTGNYLIASATVTAGGAGYGAGAYCTVIQPNGTNNGASISLTVAAGAITVATVNNAGFGFNPAFPFPYATVTDASGTGGVLAPTITPNGTTFPGVNTYHDGRQWFMSTTAQPQTLWGSVSGAFNNMSVSLPTRDSDAITRTLASREVNDIRHAVSLTQMILLTGGAEWKISAGAADVITPAQFVARPQSYYGSSYIRPLVIGDWLLYIPDSRRKVRGLQYNWASDTWSGPDFSLLSAHMFRLSGSNTNRITNWQYARDPESIVWAIRDDGTLLGFTFLNEQQLYAWHRHTTSNGFFEDVCVVQEGDESAVYFIVRRTINGQTVRNVERLHTRLFADITQAWFLDCAVQSNINAENTNGGLFTQVQVSANYSAGQPGSIQTTAVSLNSGNVGQVWELRSGTDTAYVKITSIVSSSIAAVTYLTAIPASLQGIAVSTFTLPVTINGLWHLIGETVYALADGVPLGPFTVTAGGQVALNYPATLVTVGKLIPNADLETIGADQQDQAGTIQGRKKTVNHVTVGLENSANQGLMVGQSGAQTAVQYQIKPKDFVNPLGTQPSTNPALITDLMHQVSPPTWDWYGRIKISASLPLPYTVTGVMYDFTAGS